MAKFTFGIQIFILSMMFFSCKKEINDPNSFNNAGTNDNGSGEYFRILLPVEGSCIDTAGNLLFFEFPLLSGPFYPLISAKVIMANAINSYSTVCDFQIQSFSYGSYAGLNFNGQFGLVPNDGCATLAMTSNGSLYMSYSNKNTIYRIGNGSYNIWKILNGVISISAFNNSLYAATAPIYDASFHIIQLPRIYKIDSTGGMPSLYFEFPSAFHYNNYSSGFTGGSNIFQPTNYAMSLKMDKDTSLYVAFGYDDVIYKIDKNKNLSTYISTIQYPTSIDIAANGIMYVCSAPGFHMDSTYHCTMNKPPQVYSVQQGIPVKIYEGSLFTPWFYMGNSINDSMHRVGNSFYSVSVTPTNQVFLVSPLEGKITLVN